MSFAEGLTNLTTEANSYMAHINKCIKEADYTLRCTLTGIAQKGQSFVEGFLSPNGFIDTTTILKSQYSYEEYAPISFDYIFKTENPPDEPWYYHRGAHKPLNGWNFGDYYDSLQGEPIYKLTENDKQHIINGISNQLTQLGFQNVTIKRVTYQKEYYVHQKPFFNKIKSKAMFCTAECLYITIRW